jgi:hypothetical protein
MIQRERVRPLNSQKKEPGSCLKMVPAKRDSPKLEFDADAYARKYEA